MPEPAHPSARRTAANPVRRLNVRVALVGFALAGLFDGLVLHRLLGWHHLLDTAKTATSLSGRIRTDALSEAAMFAALCIGLAGVLASRQTMARINPRCVVGMALLGFGLWHVADAAVVHWLLGLHRIRPAAETPLLWDIGWAITFGFMPLLIGLSMRETTQPDDPVAP